MKIMKKNKNTFYNLKYLLVAFFFSMGMNQVAFSSTPYVVEPFIDLPKLTSNNFWLLPLTNTTRNNQLFFTDSTGKMYRSKGQKIQPQPIINFSQNLEKNKTRIFTAVTLHPNFHLIDQTGYNVIYTAHTELYDPTKKNNRLSEKALEEQHTHDAVITEWQLSNVNKDQINISHKREIIRIAATASNNIGQLSFNPYLKSWSDEFGYLYFSLTPNETLKSSPLYSGSILRINPEKFGLRNYTIPHNNPFIKDPNIQDEIIILGVQNISQFTWSKQTKNQLIVTHAYNHEHLISLSSLGHDYLLTPPKDPLYQDKNENIHLSNVYYKGRELDTLWNTILFILPKKNDWQLHSIKVNSHTTTTQQPEKVISFNRATFPITNQLLLFIAHENELFVFDKTHSAVYKILSSLVPETSAATAEGALADEESPTNSWLYILILLALIGIALFVIKNKYNQLFIKTKSMLRSNFARFEFNTTTDEVSLFNRHENTVSKIISIKEILCSEILLNDIVINQVTHTDDTAFSNSIENALRITFEQEHRDKMIDDKVRKITLKLTTTEDEEFSIYSYLREGNQRLTKEKYHTVIEHVIDWQWYISSKINVNHIADRVIKTTEPPATKQKLKSNKPAPSAEIQNKIKEKSASPTSNKSTKNTSSGKVDTKLLDALNKLVLLKEQGYLTEDEFTLAKNNLLESLSNDS